MDIREKLIALSLIKNGDWLSMYQELKKDRSLTFLEGRVKECLEQVVGIGVMTLLDEEYPDCFKEMSAPPFVLFYQGEIKLLKSTKIAIIGGNKVSDYGQKACQRFLRPLMKSNFVIVSGLQLGIETQAQEIAMSMNKGRGIAVLASGFHNIYPKENQGLYKRLVETQLVLTEYPLAVSPMWRQYDRSAKLIQYLSEVILVLEVTEGDRRLRQLEKELDDGKPIFVLPDYYNASNSKGGLSLINKGARCLMNWEEIMNIIS